MGVVSEILKTTRDSCLQQIDAAAPSYGQIPPASVRIGIAAGCVLHTSISVGVIGFALLGLVGAAAAQYLPPQPAPAGYPPPAPPRYQSEPYEEFICRA
jgi:hypothetical protein